MTKTEDDADALIEMVLKLTGEFQPKFTKAAGDGFKTGALACKLAEAAILAERERLSAVFAKQDEILKCLLGPDISWEDLVVLPEENRKLMSQVAGARLIDDDLDAGTIGVKH